MKQLITIEPNKFNPTGKLFKHQAKYVKEAYNQPRYIAAWDMGTGKTIFAVERDLQYRAQAHVHKTLIIAPLATHEQWKETIEKGSDYKALIVNPQKRKLWVNAIKRVNSQYSYFIINIEGLKTKDLREPTPCKRCKNVDPNGRVTKVCKCKNKKLRYKYYMKDFDIDHVILDECHSIKNRKSQQTIAVKTGINAKFITDMSGSPATTKPDDLWSILHHVKPESYSSYWKHFMEYVEYTEGFDGYKKIIGPSESWVEEGLPAIQSFYSRVLKTDVFDLPDVTEQKLWVDLDPKQRKLYAEMDKDMMTWIEDNKTGLSQPMISKVAMVKQQRLQIFALGTPEFLGYKELPDGKKRLQYKLQDPSPKIDLIMKMLTEYASTKFVVFSQFAKSVDLLEQRLIKNGNIGYAKYTGSVPKKLKPGKVKKFLNDPDCQVFIATIGAAGIGLDGLQNVCSNMMFMDRAPSPMLNNQAISRLHRAGQENKVTVLDIVARDTIDDKKLWQIGQKYHALQLTLGDK